MARFSTAEKGLLEQISNDRLQTSLSKIREAMEDIWASDAPRIVKDYTDHGEKHCERIVENIVKLLDANNGHPLSPVEMYLLINWSESA